MQSFIETTKQILNNLYAQRRVYYFKFYANCVEFHSYKEPWAHRYGYKEFAEKFASLA